MRRRNEEYGLGCALGIFSHVSFRWRKRIGGIRVKSDIEIAQEARLKPIDEIAAKAGIAPGFLEMYGRNKAKVDLGLFGSLREAADGKLIFVTAINPTPAGEGKTTTAVGLTQAIGALGHRVAVCLREPSLGPTFGVKGGAAGGGFSQVLPMEDINLHFTGDIHAVGAANNLLAAMIDNHIYTPNSLQIDPRRVVWRRVIDMNDRQLRSIVTGLGGRTNGVVTETGFDITVASEVMAVLCLASGMDDLKERLSRMVVAYSFSGLPVTAADLKAVGAMAVLLKDALKPNLVQTIEGQPAFIHGGPFANIAHGNNSVLATRMALKLSDFVVTEGGFGSDLGAEKFFDIVCPSARIRPSVVVLVASVRALKYQGGVEKKFLGEPNPEALESGFANLEKHVANLLGFGVPVVVAINRFPDDAPAELQAVRDFCAEKGVRSAVSEVVARGGAGGVELAREVLEACETGGNFRPLFSGDETIEERLDTLTRRIYGGEGVDYAPDAERQLKRIHDMGYGKLPVCVAKTQYSLSDDPARLGAPTGWRLQVRDLRVSAGAGFVVALTGTVMTLPGLPKVPSAEQVDITPDGTVTGLF